MFCVKFGGPDGCLVNLAGKADANALEPKSTDLGSRLFAPLHARDIIERPGHMRAVVRGCSCLARSLRALYVGLRHQNNGGVCYGERVMDAPDGGGSYRFR